MDPATAFRAFTEEMNLWWVRGPVNFFDASRAVAKVCEPGVGGRILEVYDAAAGDVLEVARITLWQPGERLAWRSSVDDVEVDIRFEPTNALPAASADDNWDAERAWIEFHLGNSAVLVFKLEDTRPGSAPVTHVPWVFVDDLDAHYARAKSSGAPIAAGISEHGYRAYVADDLEGYRWTFAQARPTMR